MVLAGIKIYDFGTIRSLDSAFEISFSERCAVRFDRRASGRTINAHVSWITRREAFAERLSEAGNRAVAAAKTGHVVTGLAIHM